MPTDLPPDYVPKPMPEPGEPDAAPVGGLGGAGPRPGGVDSPLPGLKPVPGADLDMPSPVGTPGGALPSF